MKFAAVTAAVLLAVVLPASVTIALLFIGGVVAFAVAFRTPAAHKDDCPGCSSPRAADSHSKD